MAVECLSLQSIAYQIQSSEDICILPHVYADGDALGASLALALALERLGKKVKVYLEEDIPDVYNFLPQKEKMVVYNGEDINSNCLVIALDTGDTDRLGKRISVFEKAEITVNIDHHGTNTLFAKYNYVDRKASATGEIVYYLVKILNTEIDDYIAICLYVAISTDTGNFRYSNTTSETHTIVADLVKRNIDIAALSRQLFDTVSLEKTRLTGKVINSIELLHAGKTAVMVITNAMLAETGAKEEDCDGMVNIGRNIKGVEVAVLFRENSKGNVKVNLRSNEYVDVSKIAFEFSGGGHPRAAGCTVEGDLQAVKKSVVERISRELVSLKLGCGNDDGYHKRAETPGNDIF